MANSREGISVTGLDGKPLRDKDGKHLQDVDDVHAAIVAANAPKYQQKKAYDDMRADIDRGEGTFSSDQLGLKKREFMAPNQNSIDYLVDYQGLNITIAELTGRLPYQEDRVKAASLPGFVDLSKEERKTVLMQTPKTLHEIIISTGIGKSNGSTLSTAVILGNQIYSVNLGDSPAYVCKVSQEKVDVK